MIGKVAFMNLRKPIRVLHCLDGLGRGGIETWLMNIARAKPAHVYFDFMVRIPGMEYDDAARGLGCEIYSYPPRGKVRQAAELAGLCRRSAALADLLREKKYDIIHAHGEWRLGPTMKDAARMRVPKRIAHSHNANYMAADKTRTESFKTLWHRHIDRTILKYATGLLACSRDAGISLYGAGWERDPRHRTVYCGVPVEPFRAAAAAERAAMRNALGIPADAVVVGHVGNASRAKNQGTVVRVFHEFAQRRKNAHLVMVGLGGKLPEVSRLIGELGLESKVSLLGTRDDVPAVMEHLFDVFLLPSLYEGLPVVGLEAVCAGLFVVCSDRVTGEFTRTFRQRVEAVPLEQSPAYWAERLDEGVSKRISPGEGIALIEENRFSLSASIEDLLCVYEE